MVETSNSNQCDMDQVWQIETDLNLEFRSEKLLVILVQ